MLEVFVGMRIALLPHTDYPVLIPSPKTADRKCSVPFLLLLRVELPPEKRMVVHVEFAKALGLHHPHDLARQVLLLLDLLQKDAVDLLCFVRTRDDELDSLIRA